MKRVSDYPLRLRQVCLFFIAFSPIARIFMLPSLLAEITGEDMWLSSLLNVLMDLTGIVAIILCCKRADADFYTLIKRKFGDAAAKTVFLLYALFFMLKTVLPVCEQRDYIELTLYNTFPSILNFLPLFAICFYLSVKHLRVIGRASDIMWVITAAGFIVLFGLSVPSTDLGAILPVGAHGFSSISKGAFSSLNWFGDGAYMLFFIGNFKWEKHGGKKIIASFCLSAIFTVAFMIVFYGIFKSIAFRQRFALTEMSKYSTVINNIGRFDYVGIFLILLCSFFSLSLPVFFACNAINRAFGLKNRWILPAVLSLLLALTVGLFGEYFFAIEQVVTEKLPAVFFIFGNAIPLLSPLLTVKFKKVKKVDYETV